jgi:hypothetical protein
MKRLIVLLLIGVSVFQGCEKDSASRKAEEALPSVSKVAFSPAASAGTTATIFTFSITVPEEGIYTKLCLMQDNIPSAIDGVKSIDNPISGSYTLVNINLSYENRIPIHNHWEWVKKDGTRISQPVTY